MSGEAPAWQNSIITLGLLTIAGRVPPAQAAERVKAELRAMNDAQLSETIAAARAFWRTPDPANSMMAYPALAAAVADDRLRHIDLLRKSTTAEEQAGVEQRRAAWANVATRCILDYAMAVVATPEAELRSAYELFVRAERYARATTESPPRLLMWALVGQMQVASVADQEAAREASAAKFSDLMESWPGRPEFEFEFQVIHAALMPWWEPRRAASAATDEPSPPAPGAPPTTDVRPLATRIDSQAKLVEAGTLGRDKAVQRLRASLGREGTDVDAVTIAAVFALRLSEIDPAGGLLRAELLDATLASPAAEMVDDEAAEVARALSAHAVGGALIHRARAGEPALFDAAIPRLDAALEIFDRTGNPTPAAQTAQWLALIERARGHNRCALARGLAAIRHAEAVPTGSLARPTLLGSAYAITAGVRDELGSPVEALHDYAHAARLFAEARDLTKLKQALPDVHRVAERLGRRDEALEASHMAVRLMLDAADLEGAVRMQITNVWDALRTARHELIADALETSERVLERLLQDPEEEAENLFSLNAELQLTHGAAIVSFIRGVRPGFPTAERFTADLLDTAETRLRAAHEIAIRVGDDVLIARCVLWQSRAYLAAGRPALALARCQGLDMGMLSCAASFRPECDELMGLAHLQLGNLSDALARLGSAVDAYADRPERQFVALRGLGEVRERMGDPERARDAYERAVATLEPTRVTLREATKASLGRLTAQPVARLVHLHANPASVLHDPSRALYWAEKAKSRAFAETLGLTPLPAPAAASGPAAADLTEERRILDELSALEARLAQAEQRDSPALDVRLAIADAIERLHTVWRRLRDAEPEYVRIRTADVVDDRSLRSWLCADD